MSQSPNIWPAHAECMTCEQVKDCVGFDTSNEECSPRYGFICKECFNNFFERWHESSN